MKMRPNSGAGYVALSKIARRCKSADDRAIEDFKLYQESGEVEGLAVSNASPIMKSLSSPNRVAPKNGKASNCKLSRPNRTA